MKGKTKMKTKNVLLKFALCAVVALSSCAALADIIDPRSADYYRALSRYEWTLEKLYEHPAEIFKGALSIGVALGILAFVYIFLRRYKWFAAVKKFLFFLLLTLPCLAFLFWLWNSYCRHYINQMRIDAITVKPIEGETYEEYLKRARRLTDHLCPKCDRPRQYDGMVGWVCDKCEYDILKYIQGSRDSKSIQGPQYKNKVLVIRDEEASDL